MARIPLPEISSISLGFSIERFLFFAAVTMLTAIGCVDALSQAAAMDNTASSDHSSCVSTFCTSKFPLVIVPVLSITTAFTFFNASMATPPLKRIPRLEPAPIPQKNASGTLSTTAHGQLITRKLNAV